MYCTVVYSPRYITDPKNPCGTSVLWCGSGISVFLWGKVDALIVIVWYDVVMAMVMVVMILVVGSSRGGGVDV